MTVAVAVFLIRVRHIRTIVDGVRHAVAVDVVVARVADAIVVEVELIRVRNGLAIIDGVEHAVVVRILACVADAVVVEVRLIRVRDQRTIVEGVWDAVAIDVGIGAVRDAVVIEVGQRGLIRRGIFPGVTHGVAVVARLVDDGNRLDAPVSRDVHARPADERHVVGHHLEFLAHGIRHQSHDGGIRHDQFPARRVAGAVGPARNGPGQHIADVEVVIGSRRAPIPLTRGFEDRELDLRGVVGARDDRERARRAGDRAVAVGDGERGGVRPIERVGVRRVRVRARRAVAEVPESSCDRTVKVGRRVGELHRVAAQRLCRRERKGRGRWMGRLHRTGGVAAEAESISHGQRDDERSSGGVCVRGILLVAGPPVAEVPGP